MTTTTRLLLARHGNTFGAGDTVKRIGVTDLPLVESGLEQGRKLGNYLRKHNLIPDVIFTSTLQRAIQTAKQAQIAMQTCLTVEMLSMFNEIDYGPDENQPEDKVVARLGPQALRAWEIEAKIPNGWKANAEKIIKNWQDFSRSALEYNAGKTILVITSGGILRFAPHLTGNFNAFIAQHPPKVSTGGLCIFENTSLTTLWNCLQWNIKPT